MIRKAKVESAAVGGAGGDARSAAAAASSYPKLDVESYKRCAAPYYEFESADAGFLFFKEYDDRFTVQLSNQPGFVVDYFDNICDLRKKTNRYKVRVEHFNKRLFLCDILSKGEIVDKSQLISDVVLVGLVLGKPEFLGKRELTAEEILESFRFNEEVRAYILTNVLSRSNIAKFRRYVDQINSNRNPGIPVMELKDCVATPGEVLITELRRNSDNVAALLEIVPLGVNVTLDASDVTKIIITPPTVVRFKEFTGLRFIQDGLGKVNIVVDDIAEFPIKGFRHFKETLETKRVVVEPKKSSRKPAAPASRVITDEEQKLADEMYADLMAESNAATFGKKRGKRGVSAASAPASAVASSPVLAAASKPSPRAAAAAAAPSSAPAVASSPVLAVASKPSPKAAAASSGYNISSDKKERVIKRTALRAAIDEFEKQRTELLDNKIELEKRVLPAALHS